MLSFSLLGQVVLSKDGVPLSQFGSQKEAALLIYLAQTRQSHPRAFLADLLWESRSTKQSLSNLRTVLTRLRKQVDNALLITRDSVALNPNNQQQVDSVLLLQALADMAQVASAKNASTLQNALATYQGEFLAGFHLSDAPQFNEWVTMTREQIRRQVIAAYGRLGQYVYATGNVDDGVGVAHRWLQVDALNETAHTLLIQFLLKAGHVREAVAHYGNCVTLLQTELGVEPPAQMTALIKDAQPKLTTGSSRVTAVRHNLPAAYDQFFGRKTDQNEIHTRLDQPWCRLVTIVGQGGAGKTRLATTIARSRLNQYRDGVWLVELADISPDDDDLVEAIAVEIAIALDLRLSGSDTPIEQLLNYLQHKQMMLVLDNFEHLLEGAQIILDIVQRCEQVQLLVTSREVVGLRAEWAIALTGLIYPTSDEDEMPSDAVELFAARRAQQQRGDIAVADLTAIRRICRMVEGLPLAIELAAALTRHTTCQAIVNHLEKGFDALATSLRDVEPRHRALHVVFEMSWRTLTPILQQQLARLSVFRGGFTAAAAQQVADAGELHLAGLGDKSLLSYDAEMGRYSLHAVVRAYAAEKRPFTAPTLTKHAHYYLTLLAQHTELLQKETPQKSVAVIHPEIDNVRLAWQTGLEQRQTEWLFSALTSLSIYYQLRGLAHEGEATMQATQRATQNWGADGINLTTHAGLERARFQNRLGQYRPAIETIKTVLKLAVQNNNRWVEGMGHVWWGESLWRLGEYDAAKTKLNHALDIAHALDATLIIGWCHHQLGIIYDIQSQYGLARDHLEKACGAWQALGNTNTLGVSLNSLGLVYFHQGDLPTAQERLEHALRLCNQVDNRHLQSYLLNNLSIITADQGDYLGAQYYLQLGLELASSTGNLASQGHLYTNLGRNYRSLGELELSVEKLEQGLQVAELLGNQSEIAVALLNLAISKGEQGELLQATELYDKALAISQQSNLPTIECQVLIHMARLLSASNAKQAKRYSLQALEMAESINRVDLIEQANLLHSNLQIANAEG